MKKILMFLLSAGTLLAQEGISMEATMVPLPIDGVEEVQFLTSHENLLTVLTLDGRFDYTKDFQGGVSEPQFTPYTDRLENPTTAVAVHKGVRGDLFLFLENGELWWSFSEERISWQFLEDLYSDLLDVQKFWGANGEIYFSIISQRGVELWNNEYLSIPEVSSFFSVFGNVDHLASGESGVLYQREQGSQIDLITMTEEGAQFWDLDFDPENIEITSFQDGLIVWTVEEEYWVGHRLSTNTGAATRIETLQAASYDLVNFFGIEDSLSLGFYNEADSRTSVYTLDDEGLAVYDQSLPLTHVGGFSHSPTVFTQISNIDNFLAFQKVFTEVSFELTLTTEKLRIIHSQIFEPGVFLGSDEIGVLTTTDVGLKIDFLFSGRGFELDESMGLSTGSLLVYPHWNHFLLEDGSQGELYLGWE